MGKILLLAVLICQLCTLNAQTKDETSQKASGNLVSVPTDQDPLVPMLLELVSDDDDKKKITITKLAKTGDSRLEEFFELYRQGSVYNWPDAEGVPRIVVNQETIMDEDFNEFAPLLDPLSGKPFLVDGKQAKPDLLDLVDISPGRKLRKLVNASKFLIRLFSPDYETRLSGVKKSGDPPFLEDALPRLKEIAENSSEDQKVRWTARESIALIALGRNSSKLKEMEERLVFLEELGDLKSLRALARLDTFKVEIIELVEAGNLSPANQTAFLGRISNVESSLSDHRDSVELSGNLFRGVSYGSVLILIALGLAVTFGLMGVINMAHGELVMIGAYATYEVQRIFGHSADNAVDHYYLIALPVAFLASALVGLLMEQFVVRHLYNRPLESLLATWGVGYILIQLVRLRYGDNIGVNAPTWARGGFEITQDVILPYARLYLLALSATCVAFLYFIMRKTRMGVLIRATMQNRDMAQSLGVRTRNVDRFTFAMGSGIAGVAGYGWTIVGGVTPDMGTKLFIVDSFLVVVTGGVGELAGVLCSGLGIGVLTKLIEPMEFGDVTIGPVWGKVILLAAIVAFIQFRPAGLFAPKGRSAERK
jgi:urea transport system permease protein